MSRDRTTGMVVIAAMSLVYGALLAVGNTIEVVRGETFDGAEVTFWAGMLGLAGSLSGLLLALGGLGTLQGRRYGWTASVMGALAIIVLHLVAVATYSFQYRLFVIGTAYPVLVLALYAMPSWRVRLRLGAAGAGPIEEPGVGFEPPPTPPADETRGDALA